MERGTRSREGYQEGIVSKMGGDLVSSLINAASNDPVISRLTTDYRIDNVDLTDVGKSLTGLLSREKGRRRTEDS